MHRLLFAVFGLLIAAPSSAWGTGVEVLEGQVSINRGSGYQPVIDWVPASPGDLVMASPNSRGRIGYSQDCVVTVEPGAVVAVQEQSPCQTGGGRVRAGYLIGGVLVAGGIVGIIALAGMGDDDDNDKGKKTLNGDGDSPASP